MASFEKGKSIWKGKLHMLELPQVKYERVEGHTAMNTIPIIRGDIWKYRIFGERDIQEKPKPELPPVIYLPAELPAP